VQNKVLEAMAMARPVLLTPDAATGIEARDGEHFAVAATDAELIAKARWLVENKDAAAALGQAARRFVLEVQSWAAMLAGLPAIVGCPSEPSEKRDAA
jgi:glycosyltransferase involved in cell wall biosynthesis